MKINKISNEKIEDFLIREKTGSISKAPNGMISCDLFKYMSEKKIVCGFLEQKGLDVFKRGTIMPMKIEEVLKDAKWEQVKLSQPAAFKTWLD